MDYAIASWMDHLSECVDQTIQYLLRNLLESLKIFFKQFTIHAVNLLKSRIFYTVND